MTGIGSLHNHTKNLQKTYKRIYKKIVMGYFEDLKKNRSEMLATLSGAVEKEKTSGGFATDDRIWVPKVDQVGNGHAVIRFLPPSNGESVPFIKEYSHGFKGPGGWYVEKSLTTLGLDDPASVFNKKQWAAAAGNKALQDVVSKRSRTLSYWSNIYVIKDAASPENEGQVKLYRYGKTLFEMIDEAMKPLPWVEGDEGEGPKAPINPFDLWDGANFSVRIRTEKGKDGGAKGFRKYDKSSFGKSTPLFKDDADLKAVVDKIYSLQALIAPREFKTYEELEARLKRVMGEAFDSPRFAEDRPATPKKEKEVELPWDTSSDNNTDPSGDDEAMAMFKRLAADAY